MSTRVFLIPVLVAFTLVFTACSSEQANVAGGGSIVDNEAKQQIANHWNRRFLTCGDVMVLGGGPGSGNGYEFPGWFVEMKGGGFTINSSPLSEADKLNGVEWDGISEFHASVSRVFTPGHGWGDWTQGLTSQNGVTVVEARKAKGQWTLRSGVPGVMLSSEKRNTIHSCSEVPH
jgi:hypothetical protein